MKVLIVKVVKNRAKHYIWDKVRKNGPSKTFGRQHLTNLKWHGHFKFFNSIQDGHFWGCSRMGEERGAFWPLLPKICDTYPTMMKLGTVILYLRKILKIYKSRHTSFEFCWNQHFFTGNHKILLHQEIQIQIGFGYIISNSFNFSWVFNNCFNKHGYNFDDVSRNDYCRPS